MRDMRFCLILATALTACGGAENGEAFIPFGYWAQPGCPQPVGGPYLREASGCGLDTRLVWVDKTGTFDDTFGCRVTGDKRSSCSSDVILECQDRRYVGRLRITGPGGLSFEGAVNDCPVTITFTRL